VGFFYEVVEILGRPIESRTKPFASGGFLAALGGE